MRRPGIALLYIVAQGCQTSGVPRTAYLQDLTTATRYLDAHYANLHWSVETGRVRLDSVYRRANEELMRAATRADARAALRRVVEAFGDPHLTMRPGTAAVVSRQSRGPVSSCADAGYGSRRSRTFISEASGYQSAPRGSLPFEQGVVLTGGARVAVLRIDTFGFEPHGWACGLIWPSVVADRGRASCDARCLGVVAQAVMDTLTVELDRALRRLADMGATILIVDVTGNGGGTEWAGMAARVVGGDRVQGAPRGLAPSPQNRRELERMLSLVEGELAHERTATWRDSLQAAQARLAASLKRAKEPCDGAAVWRGGASRRGYCGVPMDGTWTTGLFAALPAPLAARAHALGIFSGASGQLAGWKGSVAVVVDRGTASASELFASLLADYADAVVVGERTMGAGCGYTSAATVAYLASTQLMIRAPDCTRVRRDGRNERAGVAPTRDVDWVGGGGARGRADRIVRAVVEERGQLRR